MPELTEIEALQALNRLRSNVVATQNAGWSNTMYPLVAILNAAGLKQEDPSDEEQVQHLKCYGGAGGYPGNELRPVTEHELQTFIAQNRRKQREREEKEAQADGQD